MTATATARFTAPQRPRSLFPPVVDLGNHSEHDVGSVGAAEPAADTLLVSNHALRVGFVLLPRAVLHAPGLSRDARLLYAVLLSYAWQQGSCFPSYQRLKADLGCGINQVTKYLRELEGAGLISRRRRGLGQSTIYTLHDPAPTRAPADATDGGYSRDDRPTHTHQISDSGVTDLVKPSSPVRRHEQDSGEYHSAEQHHSLASLPTDGDELPSAGDDDALVASLTGHGVSRRIAVRLIESHGGQAIQEQLAWQPYRPAAKNPAGALVHAIRERWPAPAAWLEVQAHAAAVARQAEADAARQAEEATRRREWEARPPAERIAGRLQFWILGQQHKRREPTPAEVEAKRAALLAELAGVAQPVDAQVDSIADEGGGAPRCRTGW